MSRSWPADYDADCYVLLPIPTATIPIIGGLLGELEKQDAWASRDDWLQGYQFACCLQECLVECGQSFSEVMTLLAVALGANEVAEADLSPAFPALAARLAAARAADTAGVLTKADAADTGEPSPIIRFEDIARLQQGKFPDTGSLWWYKPGEPVTLYDLYQQDAGLTDDPGDPEGKDLWDYLADILGFTDDIAEFFTNKGIFGKIKKDGVMIALLAVEYMNLSMNTNILINLVGHQKIFENSPGAPAATNDYLEAMLKATRGAGIKRSETDWAGSFTGVGRPPTDTPPPDSVLWALRGVDDAAKQASDTRNVIDTIATNTGTIATNTGNIEDRMDDLLQGSGLDNGRVNLFSLNQSIDALLLELQVGQIFGKLESLMQGGLISGVNLFSLREEISKITKIDNDPNVANFEDVLEGLGAINERLGWLMGDPYPNAAYTDLYDLLQQLMCICQATSIWLPKISENMPRDEPVLDSSGGLAAPEATSTAAPAELCRRARWLIDKIRVVLLNMCSTSAPSTSTLESLYFSQFNVSIPREYAIRLTTLIDHYVNLSGGNKISIVNYISSIEDNLRCALYSAANSGQAKAAWDGLLDSLGGDSERDSAILKHAIWDGLLTELFAGNIPRDPTAIYGYIDDCSDCGGGAGSPPAQGCATATADLLCGWKEIGDYRYYIQEMPIHGGWVGITRASSNGWWSGDCSDSFANLVWLAGDMSDYTVQLEGADDALGLSETGGIIFWCDNPQSDSDVVAAEGNTFGGSPVTLGLTSYVSVIVRYHKNTPAHERYKAANFVICAPGSGGGV